MPSKNKAVTVRFTPAEHTELNARRGTMPEAAYCKEAALGHTIKPSKKHPPRIEASPSTKAKLLWTAHLAAIREKAFQSINQVMSSRNPPIEVGLALFAALSATEQQLHELAEAISKVSATNPEQNPKEDHTK